MASLRFAHSQYLPPLVQFFFLIMMILVRLNCTQERETGKQKKMNGIDSISTSINMWINWNGNNHFSSVENRVCGFYCPAELIRRRWMCGWYWSSFTMGGEGRIITGKLSSFLHTHTHHTQTNNRGWQVCSSDFINIFECDWILLVILKWSKRGVDNLLVRR